MANTETTATKMTDGRTVNFGKRQKLVKDILFRGTPARAYGVRFDFRDGTTLVLDIEQCPALVQYHLMGHGASQKCGDECADLDNVADMIEAVRAMIERLLGGNWTAERQGFAGQSILIEALMEVTGKSRDAVRDVLKTLKAAERSALKTDAAVKKVYDRIEAERAKDVDTTKLLGRFAS